MTIRSPPASVRVKVKVEPIWTQYELLDKALLLFSGDKRFDDHVNCYADIFNTSQKREFSSILGPRFSLFGGSVDDDGERVCFRNFNTAFSHTGKVQ